MRRTSVFVAFLAPAIGMAASPASRAADTPVQTAALDLASVRAMIKAKQFAAARDELVKLSDSHQHADVYNLLGFSLRKLGDYPKALTYYQKALDYDPEHKGAHEYLGELYVETKQMAKAEVQLAILARLCPAVCEERDDLEKAIAAAKQGKSATN